MGLPFEHRMSIQIVWVNESVTDTPTPTQNSTHKKNKQLKIQWFEIIKFFPIIRITLLGSICLTICNICAIVFGWVYLLQHQLWSTLWRTFPIIVFHSLQKSELSKHYFHSPNGKCLFGFISGSAFFSTKYRHFNLCDLPPPFRSFSLYISLILPHKLRSYYNREFESVR